MLTQISIHSIHINKYNRTRPAVILTNRIWNLACIISILLPVRQISFSLLTHAYLGYYVFCLISVCYNSFFVYSSMTVHCVTIHESSLCLIHGSVWAVGSCSTLLKPVWWSLWLLRSYFVVILLPFWSVSPMVLQMFPFYPWTATSSSGYC